MTFKVQQSILQLRNIAQIENLGPGSPTLVNAFSELWNALSEIDHPEDVCGEMFGFRVCSVIQVYFEWSLGDRVKELMFNIIEFLARAPFRTCMNREYVVLLHSCIILQLEPNFVTEEGMRRFHQMSNETKCAACKALNSIFNSLQPSQMQFRNFMELYESFNSIHSLTILIFLSCIEGASKMPELQVAAIKGLQSFFFEVIKDGDYMAPSIPGVVSTLSKLLYGVYGSCNYKVAISAYKYLSKLFSTVFNDRELLGNTNTSKIRTSSWLNGSKHQVRKALDPILSMRRHSRQDVQESALDFCISLVNNCCNSLDVCMPMLVDTIVLFASGNEVVKTKANLFLSEKFAFQDEVIYKTLKEKVQDWITSLPRVFTSHNDQQPNTVLDAIRVTTKLLQSDSRFNASTISESLIQSLSSSISVTTSDKMVDGDALSSRFNTSLELTNSDQKDYQRNSSRLTLNDVGVRVNVSSSTQKRLDHLLESLGSSEMGVRLYESFLQTAKDTEDIKTRITLTWMMLGLLKGMNRKSITDGEEFDTDDLLVLMSSEFDSFSSQVVSELTVESLAFFGDVLLDSICDRNTDRLNMLEVQAMAGLALEGTAIIAAHMGKGFRYEVIDFVYPAVHFLGSENGLVRKRAQDSIVVMAQACGCTSVESFLIQHSDYVIDKISIKLNTLDLSPQTLSILATFIKMIGYRGLSNMTDIVATLFVLLDNYHGYRVLTESVFMVLKSLVSVVSTTELINFQLAIEHEKLKSKDIHITNISQLIEELSRKPADLLIPEPDGEDDTTLPEHHGNKPFKSLHKDDKHNETKSNDSEEQQEGTDRPMESIEEENAKNWTSPVPKNLYDVIKKIVEYADTFLTSDSASLKRSLLSLLIDAVPVLSTSKDDFLPTVNLYWPILVSRLQDSEVYVLEETLKVMGLTFEYAGDFMTTRFVSVWSKLRTVIPDMKRVIGRGPAYSYDSRMLIATMNFLAKALSATGKGIPPDLLDDILNVVVPIIANEENKLEGVKSLRKVIEEINADALWLELAKTGRIDAPSPPESTVYPPITFHPLRVN